MKKLTQTKAYRSLKSLISDKNDVLNKKGKTHLFISQHSTVAYYLLLTFSDFNYHDIRKTNRQYGLITISIWTRYKGNFNQLKEALVKERWVYPSDPEKGYRDWRFYPGEILEGYLKKLQEEKNVLLASAASVQEITTDLRDVKAIISRIVDILDPPTTEDKIEFYKKAFPELREARRKLLPDSFEEEESSDFEE